MVRPADVGPRPWPPPASMETWAHGLDVAEDVGVQRKPTDRLKSIAHLGCAPNYSFTWSANSNRRQASFSSNSPHRRGGEKWIWGQTMRRACAAVRSTSACSSPSAGPEDLALRVSGADARTWVSIAQCFAGPAGVSVPTTEFAVNSERCSGAPGRQRVGLYGDRISAVREMLEGGELDYLTGDYLAELTMLILGRDKLKNPNSVTRKRFCGRWRIRWASPSTAG